MTAPLIYGNALRDDPQMNRILSSFQQVNLGQADEPPQHQDSNAIAIRSGSTQGGVALAARQINTAPSVPSYNSTSGLAQYPQGRSAAPPPVRSMRRSLEYPDSADTFFEYPQPHRPVLPAPAAPATRQINPPSAAPPPVRSRRQSFPYPDSADTFTEYPQPHRPTLPALAVSRANPAPPVRQENLQLRFTRPAPAARQVNIASPVPQRQASAQDLRERPVPVPLIPTATQVYTVSSSQTTGVTTQW